MHVISKKPFSEACKKFPNHSQAIIETYKILRKGEFKTPDELKNLFPSLDNFKYKAKRLIDIQTKEDYEWALAFVEQLFDDAKDSRDDPLNDLIGIISNAIQRYESRDDELVAFERKVSRVDSAGSILRILMDQYHLTESDLEKELGSGSLASKILKGERDLTRLQIANLANRFKIDPSLFF